MLRRLYSETSALVEDIHFGPGINIVLGRYSADKKERRGINGIGKSSVIRLINYCFLSGTAEKTFKQKKYDFLRDENHSISLEIDVRGKNYILKRYFGREDIAFFGRVRNQLEEYEKPELKTLLTNKLFPTENERVFLSGNRFGTIMHFFVKDDIENQKRADPIHFVPFSANKKELMILNFYLLNLPTRNLINYEEVSKEHSSKTKAIKELEKTAKATTGKSIEEFRSEKLKIESSIAKIEESIGAYQFLANYERIEKRLIELTGNINDGLIDYHAINRKLQKIKNSYQTKTEIDASRVQKIYNEAMATFGSLVKKNLDEIVAFNAEILENRNKFLVQKERQLKKDADAVLSVISVLEEERSNLYKKLKAKGALDSIENAYEELIKEKSNLERNIQFVGQIDDIEGILADMNVTISEIQRDIIQDVKTSEKVLNELRSLFLEILENAILLGEGTDNAYFNLPIIPNAKRNQTPAKIEVEIPKADALGQSRLRIIAYDLMILLKNIQSNRRFPNFLVHDGVFHGIAHRTLVNTLNFVYKKQLLYPNFQYILTFNEDEIEVPEGKEGTYGKFEFNWKEHVSIELSDVPGKMLFKRNFD